MNCSRCGMGVNDGARFCAGCGAPVDDATIARPAEDPELVRIRSALSARYRIDSLLGRGGMGAVYSAYEPSLDRFVAIKVIPESAGNDTGFVERFRREARLAAKLRHPRIVTVFEVGEAGGIHYFAMDYVEGETLRSLVRRRESLPPDEALAIIREVGDAVAHAHRKGIIHRDLKPENIMIGTGGEIFVMDFGLARGMEDPSMTASGTIMGTPLYMSPEQLRAEEVDPRSDIFALGLIFFYCLTGEHLFEGNSVSAIISKQLSIDIEKVIGADPRIPSQLREPLIHALQRDRDARTPSLDSFLNAIMESPGEASKPPSLTPTIREITAPASSGSDRTDAEKVSASEARRRERLRSLLDGQ